MREFIEKFLGGRPMQRIVYCFPDVVVHKPVYLWLDCYGRYWLATSKWGWFRVKSEHNTDIWIRK